MRNTAWMEKVLAAILARVFWFVGACVFLVFAYFAGSRRSGRAAMLDESPVPFLLAAAAIAGVIALVGPLILTAQRNRGMGKLAQVKAMSTGPAERKRKARIRVAKPKR